MSERGKLQSRLHGGRSRARVGGGDYTKRSKTMITRMETKVGFLQLYRRTSYYTACDTGFCECETHPCEGHNGVTLLASGSCYCAVVVSV